MKFLFLSIFLLTGITLYAQPILTGYADIGSNNISEGLFIKTGTLGSFQSGKNTIGAGGQWDLFSNIERVITGLYLYTQRTLSIKDFKVNLKGFYSWSGFSKLLKETNLGIVAHHRRDHMEFQLGNNFRTYAYTQKAIDQYDPEDNAPVKIHENWNLMYMFAYYLKPSDNPWNLRVSVTSFDHFLINQETNPVVNLMGSVDIKPELVIFSEAWYKTSGAFNLNVNYFGFFLRTGIIWKIK